MEVRRFFALSARLGHDPAIVSRILSRSPAVPRGLVLVCLALAMAACGGSRPKTASGHDAEELATAVERLRVERRLRERKIRDLEHQLASRTTASPSSSSPHTAVPSLPVQVLAPSAEAAASPSREPPSLSSASRLSDGEAAEMTVGGERVVGVADDGSEIVYVDDAATGKVVAPSPEVLAEMGRARRSSASPTRLDGPEIDEGDAQALLDAAASEKLPLAPLSSLGRRASQRRSAAAAAPPPRATAPAPKPATATLRVTPAAPAPGKAPPAPTVRGSDNGGAEVHYKAAIALIRKAEYPAAITSLRQFLERHPRHDYADNAQYWLGEAYYAQQQYAQALSELRKVAEHYPLGNKVPDSLLKVGYCHLAMGERDKSTAALRELIRLYPRTEPALLAAKKLEESP
jgi:tol-pal system protein YbgF